MTCPDCDCDDPTAVDGLASDCDCKCHEPRLTGRPGWFFDPVSQTWQKRIGPNRWLVVPA